MVRKMVYPMQPLTEKVSLILLCWLARVPVSASAQTCAIMFLGSAPLVRPGMVWPGNGRPAPRRFWHSGMPDPNGAAARSQAGFTFSLWKEAKSAHPARSQRSWAESQAESHFLQSRRSNSHSGLPGWARYGLSRVRPLAGFGTAAYRMLTGLRWICKLALPSNSTCQINKPPTKTFLQQSIDLGCLQLKQFKSF